jgi:hypothetical protein
VYVDNGSFTMEGGEISGNTRGVYIHNGSLTMSGGKIAGNTGFDGGGVYVGYIGRFTMGGGEISGNTASGGNSGGGVYVGYSGSFTMNGGEISGNTSNFGNGVSVGSNGAFTMSGGKISGNTAFGGGGSGGGVYIFNGSFSKTGGGIIYGSDAAGSLKNTAGLGDTYGHVVYYMVSGGSYPENDYYRDITLNVGDNISTDIVPSSGTGNNWIKKE